MITDVLRGFLIGRPAITALVSPDNIIKRPIDVETVNYAILAFRETGNTEQYLLNDEPGLNIHSITIVCVNKSPEQTLKIAKAVENDLIGFKGDINGIYCVGIQKVGYSDEYEPDTHAHVGVLSLQFFTRG